MAAFIEGEGKLECRENLGEREGGWSTDWGKVRGGDRSTEILLDLVAASRIFYEHTYTHTHIHVTHS